MAYSKEELEKLMSDIESDTVERKESWKGDAPEKARQAICAFANDLPDRRRDGVLFVGVTDQGKPSKLQITDELLRTLADIRTDGKITPPPSMSVSKEFLIGAEVAIVTVRRSDSPPVRYEGRCWIRIGSRRAIAGAQDERILSERRRSGDLPFDIQPCLGSTIDDIDLQFFSHSYLPNAIAREVLAENGRSLAEQLTTVKFVATSQGEIPTTVGLLTSGKRPSDLIPCGYVQFLRFQGRTLTDEISDQSEVRGRIDEVVKAVEDKFRTHNHISADFKSGSIERSVFTYPLIAFQQLFRNSVMHRTYEGTNAPIRVFWFDDRLEIMNPGGPYGVVSPENFGSPGCADYRNPNLAEAMKNLGFAQRFGVGILTAQKALIENGNPPLGWTINDQFTTMIMLKAK